MNVRSLQVIYLVGSSLILMVSGCTTPAKIKAPPLGQSVVKIVPTDAQPKVGFTDVVVSYPSNFPERVAWYESRNDRNCSVWVNVPSLHVWWGDSPEKRFIDVRPLGFLYQCS